MFNFCSNLKIKNVFKLLFKFRFPFHNVCELKKVNWNGQLKSRSVLMSFQMKEINKPTSPCPPDTSNLVHATKAEAKPKVRTV